MKANVGNKFIGEGEPCFIIAEAGVNHNGDINLAKKLIGAAKDAKADAVKFQTFKAENVVIKNAEKAEYQKETTERGESQYGMLKKLELTEEDFRELADYAKEKDILFLSSSFEEALNVIRSEGVEDVILLQCVSNYPARIEDVNLRAMETLKQAFKIPVGFSDHTLGITASIAAAAFGACVIEKHFTLDRNLQGPDHKASLEPKDLKEMVQVIRDVEKALGTGMKRPAKDEEEIKKVARRSIVAKVDISGGEIISEDMLDVKRPGTGIEPRYMKKIVGARAKVDIKRDDLIAWSELNFI
jgi:N-acetylneuraminate synthase/N,N'-diacetyllegionaminate synthase